MRRKPERILNARQEELCVIHALLTSIKKLSGRVSQQFIVTLWSHDQNRMRLVWATGPWPKKLFGDNFDTESNKNFAMQLDIYSVRA